MCDSGKNMIEDSLRFKSEIENKFERENSLNGRDYYSSMYSLPQVSPVVWINLNPSGTVEDYKILSDQDLAAGRHEFWHGDGRTSKATGRFLQRLFGGPQRKLRSIQGTNVAWERSKRGSDIDLTAASKRAAPYLRRYLQFVRPEVLIFGGSGAFRHFTTAHRAKVIATHGELLGNWGPKRAKIFGATTLEIPELGRLEAILVSHPSYGERAGVLEACKARVGHISLPDAIS